MLEFLNRPLQRKLNKHLTKTKILTKNNKTVHYYALWPGFDPTVDYQFWTQFLSQNTEAENIHVLLPFTKGLHVWKLILHVIVHGRWDYFITGEHAKDRLYLAKKSIGFHHPSRIFPNRFRFPYWKWYLNWQEINTEWEHFRFGKAIETSELTLSINQRYGQLTEAQFNGANHRIVILTSHFHRPRRKLIALCNAVLGCDIFGRKTQKFEGPKKELLKKYLWCLCPENKPHKGYITEKIPEAFAAGCIPVTYCDPSTLSEDFNSNAVVNLYHKSDAEIVNILSRLQSDYSFVNNLRDEPLLTKLESLEALSDFIRG